jgi:organic hydroperoxide reductase OsmC/OhrA
MIPKYVVHRRETRVAVKAKVLEFEGGVDPEGRLLAGGDAVPMIVTDGWNPEALVLAAVTRCSLASLRYYADRAGIAMTGSGRAHGTVTAREDGIYAFVEVHADMDVRLDPPPEPAEIAKLIRRAESGCFVGQSLRAKPTYRWIVNGAEAQTA